MQKKFCAFAFVFLLVLSVVVITFPAPMTKAATTPAWDFEDHGYGHISFTTLTDAQMISELTMMTTLFQQHELPEPKHFAYPNGEVNAAVIDVLSRYRLSGRTGSAGAIFPETYPVADWFDMSSSLIDESTTYADVKGWIDQAIADKGLLNLFTHEVVVSGDPSLQGTTQTILGQVLDYLVEQQNADNLKVMTMRQAYGSYDGQTAVVVMSFDDCYVSDYSVVWPMFKERGLVGTSYLVGSVVESTEDRLTWSMISEMAPSSPPAPSPPAIAAWGVTVNVSPSDGGTTTFPPGSLVAPQYILSVEAYPASGYAFSHWTFDNQNITDNPMLLPQQQLGTYHALVAVFINATEPMPSTEWILTANSTMGGSVVPSGILNVTDSITLNATADVNYTFGFWRFDDLNLTSAENMTLYNVTSTNATSSITIPQQNASSNHTLTAFFTNETSPQPSPWTLTINTTGSGSTTPTGLVNVTGEITVNATADTNSTFSYWQFDDLNITSAENMTLYNVTSTNTASTITIPSQNASSNHTLTAFFANETIPSPQPWALTVNSSEGGTTTPTGLMNVTGTIQVNATADVNYTFGFWRFDDLNLTSAENMTLYNVTSTNATSSITIPQQNASSNHTLTAFFTNTTTPSPSPQWSLYINISVGGFTTPSGFLNVTGPLTVNASALENYTFGYWQFDNMNITSTADLALYQVTSTNSTSTITLPAQTDGLDHALKAFFIATETNP